MHRHLTLLVLCLLLPCAAFAQSTDEDTAPVPETLGALEARILQILDTNDTPAASVALVTRDAVLWTAGVGTADLASGRPATADTLFRVGSITKSFTALAVLRYVEEGRVRLDDPIRELVPHVAYENRWAESDPVRLAQVIEHTAGFDDIHLAEYAHEQADPPIALSDGLAFHPHSRISRWRPGLYTSYCNSGPAIAAAVLEEIDGRPFEEILDDKVLHPLGMTTATLLDPGGSLLARGYKGDGQTLGEYWHIWARPSGSLNASSREMANFLRMFLNRGAVNGAQVWQSASIDRMETPETSMAARAGLDTGYGLASYVTQAEGFAWQGHSGGMETFVADYAYNLEHGLGYFVAINTASRSGVDEIRDVLRAYLTRDLEASPEPAAQVPANELAEIAGYYQNFVARQHMIRFINLFFGIKILQEVDGELFMGSPSGKGERLIPLGGGHFRAEGDARAAWVYVPGTDDGDLFLGQGNLRRVSALGVWLRWITAALCALLMASALLFPLIWVPRLIYRRLRGLEPPFSRASLWHRVQPLVTVLVLLVAFGAFAVGLGEPIRRLSAPTLPALGFAIGTVLYAVLALFGAAQWWRTRGESGVGRGVRVHAFLLHVAHLLTVVGLAWWGLLGLRTWS